MQKKMPHYRGVYLHLFCRKLYLAILFLSAFWFGYITPCASLALTFHLIVRQENAGTKMILMAIETHCPNPNIPCWKSPSHLS